MAYTSLSAGKIIRKILTENEEIQSLGITKIFPVVTDAAILPYIAYRRTSLTAQPAKSPAGVFNPDETVVEVLCFTQDYESGITLAEAVRAAMDGKQAESGGIRMRSCIMTDSEETWQDDAYIQRIVFKIKVSSI